MNKEFILFTSNNFPTGGPGATYINLFCKGVKENAGRISVFLFKGYIYKGYKNSGSRKNYTDYGVKYTYLGFSTRSKIHFFKVFQDIIAIIRTIFLLMKLIFIRKKIIILVYSDTLLFNVPVYFFSKLFRIKIVSFVPEFLENEKIQNVNIIQRLISYSFLINFNLLNTLSDKLIVFSFFLKDEYINKGYDKNNIIIQPNLTDFKGWYIPQKIKYTVGYAGTPSKKDGIIDLIFAIKLLKEKGELISVIIVGDSINNESLIPYFKKTCNELGILNQIIFTGLVLQEHVKDYLNSCQILAITRPNTKQTKAGFPTKIGEYMACKKIVLATKFGDVEKYFSHKTDIILAEPENPLSIAENILWILNNPEESKIIAKNGFKSANQVLNYNVGVKKIMDFLN